MFSWGRIPEVIGIGSFFHKEEFVLRIEELDVGGKKAADTSHWVLFLPCPLVISL